MEYMEYEWDITIIIIIPEQTDRQTGKKTVSKDQLHKHAFFFFFFYSGHHGYDDSTRRVCLLS